MSSSLSDASNISTIADHSSSSTHDVEFGDSPSHPERKEEGCTESHGRTSFTVAHSDPSSSATGDARTSVVVSTLIDPEAPKTEHFIPPGASLSISRVLKMLKIHLNEKDLAKLLGDFTDDRPGVEKFVALMRGGDLEEQLLATYGLEGSKSELSAFCEWFDTRYNNKEAKTQGGSNPSAAASRPRKVTWVCRDTDEKHAGSASKFVSSVDDTASTFKSRAGNTVPPPPAAHHQQQDISRMPAVAFPESSRVNQLVDRYNRNVRKFLPSLCVDCEDVESMYKRLKVMCRRGLVGSLVFAPRDLSVFVREEVREEDSPGCIIDVALCTQDRTHRSNVRLDGDLANDCDNRVGVLEARERVQAAMKTNMHPVVRAFLKERVVETITCPTTNLCTIELAPTHNPSRIQVQKEVAASDLWGYHGHQRLKFDFDRSAQDQDLFASWLICMTLFERKTTETEHNVILNFLSDCYADFEAKKMTKNVNYETMFRSKGPQYRSGRLSWPLILGLCMAKNLKEELQPLGSPDPELQSKMGTYCGMFTDAHFLCGGVAVALSSILFIVAAFAVTVWNVALLRLIAMLSLPSALAVVVTNYYFLQDARLSAFLFASDRRAPRLSSKDRDLAIRLLFSESGRRHFDGTNLSFTGETFTGTSKSFGYRFTYQDLRELGFGFYCDSWGREHLRVPKTGALVRMDWSHGDVDYFVRVEEKDEPKLLFAKPWYSTTTNPG